MLEIRIQIQNTERRRRKGYAEGAEGLPKEFFECVAFPLIELDGF
jgi:hypothetical protein